MPVTPTYPGVYVEEIPSGVRTIVGVSTAVTAFVGYLRRGPMNEAVQLLSYADFERQYGGLDKESVVSYGVRDFFLNGGTEAWVVRTAAGVPAPAQITIENTPGGGGVLEVAAINEGAWGDNLRLDVDRDTSDPNATFNLTVTLYQEANGTMQPATSESFRNLSIDSDSADYVLDKINEESDLIRIPEGSTVGPGLPAATGTVLDVSAVGDLNALTYPGTVDASLTSGGATTNVGTLTLAVAPTSLTALRNWLQSELRGLAASLSAATVSLIQSDDGSVILLQVRVNGEDPADILELTGGTDALANLTASQVANSQQYLLGQAIAGGAQSAQSPGDDGAVSTATEIIGSEAAKQGLWALEDVDLFNLLCLPLTSAFDDDEAMAVLTEAIAYCERRRAFLIVDIPEDVNEVEEIRDWVDNNASTLRSDHAAIYFPRIRAADPLNDFRARAMPVSGLMAGLYARTDSERGVWKAPAGTEAVLRNVKELDYKLSDPENGTLNPLGINCLRSFPVYGNISWGARTLRGADRLADEYKYIPVRRLALYLEESLYRGLKWVVFEPNDEPLWAQIRLNVGAFLHNLFRQGAFQGTKPSEAYFVKCDSETTTQNDRNLGMVNILVGFAPLKPAEFVMIKIQQIAGQIDT